MRVVREVEVNLLAAMFRDEHGSAFDVLIAAMGDDEEEGLQPVLPCLSVCLCANNATTVPIYSNHLSRVTP